MYSIIKYLVAIVCLIPSLVLADCSSDTTIYPAIPSIVYPAAAASNIASNGFTIVTSDYSDASSDTSDCFDYFDTQIQVDVAAGDFSSPVIDTTIGHQSEWFGENIHLDVHSLSPSTSYKVRARHQNLRATTILKYWSDWCTAVSFSTKALSSAGSIANGTIHYVNSSSAGGDGTTTALTGANAAFTDIDDVRGHTFIDGDDLYFRAGQSWTFSHGTKLLVDCTSWDGSETDRVVVGAYTSAGVFELGAEARPILDAEYDSPCYPTWGYGCEDPDPNWEYADEGRCWSALVYVHGNQESEYGCVTIKDLYTNESAGEGLFVSGRILESSHYLRYINIDNVVVNEANTNGLVISGVSYSYVQNCYILETNDPECFQYTNGGAALTCTANSSDPHTTHNIIRNNRIEDSGHEGIGNYQGANYNINEYNVVQNAKTSYIYLCNSEYNTARYNLLVYNGVDGRWSPGYWEEWKKEGRGWGVGLENEAHEVNVTTTGNTGHRVYGNIIVGQGYGISILNEGVLDYYSAGHPYLPGEGVPATNHTIVGNTLVDNGYNFYFDDVNARWEGIVIANNLSLTPSDASAHSYIGNDYYEGSGVDTRSADEYSPHGVTWIANYFDSLVTGDAASGSGTLNNQTGESITGIALNFRNLGRNPLTGSEFKLMPNCTAIDAGVSESTINARYAYMLDPQNINYKFLPPDISIIDGGLYGARVDIGAVVLGTSISLAASEIYPSGSGTPRIVTATWINPNGTNGVIYNYRVSGAASWTELYNGVPIITEYNLGPFDYGSNHEHRIDIVHDGGTQIGVIKPFQIANEDQEGGVSESGNSGNGFRGVFTVKSGEIIIDK